MWEMGEAFGNGNIVREIDVFVYNWTWKMALLTTISLYQTCYSEHT